MVKEAKIAEVEQVKKTLAESPIIGLVDMHKAPSRQMQRIRNGLRGKATIRMVKKSILTHAIEAMGDENIKQIESHLPKQPAIVLTGMEPFRFYVAAKGMKFKTFAKAGDVSNDDIWVNAGPTPLMAGPAIGEFQAVGLPANIEAGKIAIRKDTLFVKKGEVIDAKKANILRKLGVEPTDVSLNVVAMYDNGRIYLKEVLDLALRYPEMLKTAISNARNLAVDIAFPTKESMQYLLSKAVIAAKALNEIVVKAVSAKEPEPVPAPEIAAGQTAAPEAEAKGETTQNGGAG
ncbi:MAG: 50S ribosomal protein L10 [Candidatus Aenigmatarchaeota archaeon]